MDERPDLRAVLEHYGARVRDRASQMISCILHDDRTPSCSVNLNKGVWNCKSCGKAGDSFALIMEKEEVDFRGARAFAASLGLATGDADGGGEQLSGSSYGGRRKVPVRERHRPTGGGYVPAWKRK